jgi:hypothetical protein
VHIPPVPDLDDLDDETVVEYLVGDPVVADPHPICMRLADDADAPRGPWLVGEEVDGSSDALLLLSRKAGKDLERSSSDLHPIGGHCNPRSAFTSSQGT